MSTLTQWKGRKIGFLTTGLIIIIGWIIVVFATNPATILVSESLHGIGSASLITISITAISEIVNPTYRNLALRAYNVGQSLGMAVMGSFTLYVNWRTAAIVMSIPMVMSVIIVGLWPESPSWLAYKGEFDKCKKTFFSVRSIDDRAVNELQELITAQTEIKHKDKFSIRDVINKVFYVPIFHMFVMMCLTYWSGSIVISIYSIQIIKEATGDETYAIYGGMAIHFIIFFGNVLNGFLTRYFKNRPILLTGILGVVIFLSVGCVVNLLQALEILANESKIGFYSYLGFIVCMSSGVMPMTFDMGMEVIPVRYRGVGGSLYIITISALHTTTLKLTPYLIKSINVWGTLLIYTLNATICGAILWKYLPETKGRTLQQIEDYYTFGKFTGNRIVDTTQAMISTEKS